MKGTQKPPQKNEINWDFRQDDDVMSSDNDATCTCNIHSLLYISNGFNVLNYIVKIKCYFHFLSNYIHIIQDNRFFLSTLFLLASTHYSLNSTFGLNPNSIIIEWPLTKAFNFVWIKNPRWPLPHNIVLQSAICIWQYE
jgi:hypothetical protein